MLGHFSARRWAVVALVACLGSSRAEAPQAGTQSSQPLPKYYWSQKGQNVRQDGASPEIAPRNLSNTRSWNWRHPVHKHLAMPVGTPLIDDKRNVYIHDSVGGIHKFSHSGVPSWSYNTLAASPYQPTIWNGTLLGSADPGTAFALDMETGREIWRKQITLKWSGDGSSILSHDGVAVTVACLPELAASCSHNQEVVAFSIFDGNVLWRYQAMSPLYNVMPGVLEERQLLVFSDQWGCVYGLSFRTGKEVWKNCEFRSPLTFSTANGILGSNGVFYAAFNTVSGWDYTESVGCLLAVNATDGTTVWSRKFQTALQASPGVGRLRPGADLSVIVGIGDNTGIAPVFRLEPWAPNSFKIWMNRLSIRLGDWSRFLWGIRPDTGQKLQVVALDAATGTDQWRFETPTWWRPTCAGDEERAESWMLGGYHRGRAICTCDSWSSPAIGGDGTTYIGSAYGVLYSLKDEDGDGVVSGDKEVSSEDLGAAIIMPPSIGPGMLAAVTCDEVVVYRT